MITDEIYKELKTVDLNLTENVFTTKYLKTSRSYLCNRRNKKRDVSNDVLLNLYSELNASCENWESFATRESDIRRRVRWRGIANFYKQLAKQVVTRMLDRAAVQKATDLGVRSDKINS